MESQHKSSLLILIMVGVICLSFLHELQAVPVTRTLSLADHEHYFSNGQMVEDEKWWVGTDEQVIQGRSDIESLDYPPSGANHSHEPGGGSKPPIKNSP
ncbi:hypothetical protein SUGI_1110450 [Cryptomeria japonica]|uniref:uncharacterized protein LOC131038363 isoform X1 n=1 Tax=Cryptomeria japonica TaxID=3369 RepID=UPI00241480EC|nr:uncharacterized protein LOC131038363 isoform X1 [Cryptomeria japonica]GLJ52204.1 hypothetical protein SUGI_1110450 [Cryptomeria japonica]